MPEAERKRPVGAARVLGALRHWAARALDRLDARGRHLRRLTARIQKLETVSKQMRFKWERERAALKRASASRHRSVLSPEILEALLPLRAHTVAARASDAGAARHDERLHELSAAYRQAVADPAGPATGLARTSIQGLTWWVPVTDLHRAAEERVIAKQRFPYRNITQTRELAVGTVMLDIGANTGRMSIPRIVLGDFQRAYCAEPDPLNFGALVRNVASNGLRGLVLPDQVAIGSACGTVRLQRAKYSGGHRILAEGSASDAAIEVPCLTLDEWCRWLSIDVDLVTYVKVDTQGWELHVLQGAPQLLSRPHVAWQLEVSPKLLEAAGTTVSALYELCGRHFTHFIDLGKHAEGPRARRTADLEAALRYLDSEAQTDVVLFNAGDWGLGTGD